MSGEEGMGGIKGGKAAAEEVEAARRQWLAQASHEIRTPLTIIKSHASLMREKQDRLVSQPEKLRDIVEALDESADRLNERLEELLGLLKMELSAPQPREVELDPGTLLEEETAAMAERTGKVVRIHREGYGHVFRGDPSDLRRAFRYMLDYALRAASPDEDARLSLLSRDDGWEVRLPAGPRNGSGRESQAGRGMGLHLYYASRVMEAQGGDLLFEPAGD